MKGVAGMLASILAFVQIIHSAQLLDCPYYERDSFLGAVAAPCEYTAGSAPVAGIVPHHLLASDMIAGFLQAAAQYSGSYDTVVVLAPMHYPETCEGARVVTSTAGWQTPTGVVPPAAQANDLLAKRGLGAADLPGSVEKDHGISGLVPFISHYLPGTPVLPVLLRHDVQQAEIDLLVDFLLQNAERTLVLISVDFSHYLSPGQAAWHDKETEAAIEAFRYDMVKGFADSNVDSPPALFAFLKFCEGLCVKPRQLDHSSSAEKLPLSNSSTAYADGVTSYFVYVALTGE